MLPLLLLAVLTLGGCASVRMGDTKQDAILKEFQVPKESAGVYLYRNELFGAAVRLDVAVNGRTIGETGAKTYLYFELSPGTYTITSKGENTDAVTVDISARSLTYIWQEVRMGFLYARTRLHVVSADEGKKGVLESSLAGTGNVVAATSQQPPGRTTVSTGTGFAVLSPTSFVTAYHVIKGARALTVTCVDGPAVQATVQRIDPANDLALLQLASPAPSHLDLASENSLASGQKVFTIGYPAPGILGPEPKYSDGSVSSLSGLAGAANLIQITVPIQPGNSGGPIADESGRVVGVVTSTAAFQAFLRGTGALPQNINWAVRSEYLRPLLSNVNALPTQRQLAPIERVKQSSCLVVAAASEP